MFILFLMEHVVFCCICLFIILLADSFSMISQSPANFPAKGAGKRNFDDMISLKQNDSVLGIDGHLCDSKRQKRLNYGTLDGGAKTMNHSQSDLQAQNIVASDCQLRSQNGARLAGTGLLVTSENMNGNGAICEFCQSSKISEVRSC